MKNKDNIIRGVINYIRANEEDLAEALDIDFEKNPEFLDPHLGVMSAAPDMLDCIKNLVEKDLIKDKRNDHFNEVLEVINKAEGK